MSELENKAVDEGRELAWDDTIECSEEEYIKLEEGDYEFTVTNFKRGRYPGGAKIPSCPKAELTLRIDTFDGVAFVNHTLFLHTKCTFGLSKFFQCIGQVNKGEKLTMNWQKVIGATGKAHVGLRTYKAKDGTEREVNNITAFYPKKEETLPEGFTPVGGYKEGEF